MNKREGRGRLTWVPLHLDSQPGVGVIHAPGAAGATEQGKVTVRPPQARELVGRCGRAGGERTGGEDDGSSLTTPQRGVPGTERGKRTGNTRREEMRSSQG